MQQLKTNKAFLTQTLIDISYQFSTERVLKLKMLVSSSSLVMKIFELLKRKVTVRLQLLNRSYYKLSLTLYWVRTVHQRRLSIRLSSGSDFKSPHNSQSEFDFPS
jgi:hypothetical protein